MSDTVASTTASNTATGSSKTNSPVTFDASDLDAYARGIAREMEVVRAAQERAASAKTAEERGQAIQAQYDMATVPEGAKSAGLPEARYREIRDAVHEVFKTLDFQGKIAGPLSMDTTHATPEMRKMLTSDPFAALPPSSRAALRERMDKLVPLWAQYTSMTAVAG